MLIALHKQARTTPAVRAEIAASDEPVSVLAQRYNITESTVRKWQARVDFNDRSHTPHRLQTTLTTGFSTLSVGSIITFFAIVAGAAATMKLEYWRMMKSA
jgi:hypothetical protein